MQHPGDSTLFGRGPVGHLDGLLAFRKECASAFRRAAAAFLMSWPPLVVLAAWERLAVGEAAGEPLLLDFLAIARYAIAVPLLILAESIYVPRFGAIHREFAERGFVADRDRTRFAALSSGTERLLQSIWLEMALVALVYGMTFWLQDGQYRTGSASWDSPIVGGRQHRSLAGWWRVLVAHPLFLVLVLRSLVRLCAWTRVLWGIARMDLQLIPAHADLVGGLRFVTLSVHALLPLAFTFGVLMAARVAEGVLVEGLSPWQFRNQIAATPVVALLLFACPLLVFQRPLWKSKMQGTFEYGLLATRVGRCFETRWLSRRSPVNGGPLQAPDFSATADLFSIVSNVRESRVWLLDSSVIVPLLITALLPFVPLLFAVVPVEEIVTFLWRTVA